MSENAELRDRVTKVEQRQLQNDNSPKGMDDFSSEEPVDIPDSVIAV
jgi:hypothetical protein